MMRTALLCLLLFLMALPGALAQGAAAAPPANEPAAAEKLPSDNIAPEKLAEYADLAQKWMVEYIQVDTTNPPGNEARAAAFYKKIFDAEGIENQVFEIAPGRANIWARIPAAAAAQRPIVMLNHEDVVSSVAGRWKHP